MWENITKIIFFETRKKNNFDIKYVTLEKNWIYYDLLKMKEFVIQWRKFELKRSYLNEFMNFLIF